MFKDLVLLNRSYRGYDQNHEITKEQLVEFVDCARFAPSSVNVQPFKYFLAYDKETVAKVQSMTKWARELPHLMLPYEGTRPTAFIIVCQDLTIEKSIARYQKDVGIVAQTMLLAATEQGLGGCMIGNYSAKKVKETFDFPENIAPVLIIAFGKPDEKIVLTDLKEGDKTAYYRDEAGVHYVPKRLLEDIIL